jgi:phosphatidylserine decarboxylase
MVAKEGFPFIFIPLAIAGISAFFGWWIAAIVLLALTAFMIFFFRDPGRTPPHEDGIVVSAADGTVTRIEETENGKLVSVFLSPLDVHINRSPVAGVVTKVDYIRGRKIPATSNDASFVNERNSLTIRSERITVVCTQIAGILARRIVCRCKEGDNLELGEKFGMIKFSSRTDVLMPGSVEVIVKTGDKVKGGETIIARLR